MITPTLFVGLGTTGTNILIKLRELMAEEYGHAGLPLFRYIAIETHGEVNVKNTNQMDDYERINLIRATIPNVKPIRLKLTPREPLHNPHLVDWLDRELLKIEAGGFMDGASNIRMAGRLCLWENWPDIQTTFANAIGAIMAPATKRKTINILTERKKIAGHPLDDTGSIKVYVLGSLCGGSCSGMLIDVGYFFRYLLSAYGDKSRINGIFTMFDENHAAKPDAMFNIRSANCYASLLELNYYHHQETTYDITFPDGRKIENMREKPFDYTLFVSPSGKIAGNQFSTGAGNFDEHGLNLMVALNLFAESAADTGGVKNAIRTNYTSHADFGTLKPVREGEIRTMIRYMASFGLTAVWYPKYRIASAAACSIGNKLCDNWLGSHIPQATTVRDAETVWNQILNANIDTLTSPEGQPPIKSRIDTHLANARKQWLNTEISSDQLSQNMEEFPVKDSFRKKFEQDGEYVELMNMQVPECKKAFNEAIEQTLNNQLGSIDFEGTRGLGDVKMFFETLDKRIENSIQNCPDRMPTLNLGKLDFSPMERADNNLWLKLIFLGDDSVKAHRDNMVKGYCNLIIGSPTSFYESVRNHCIKPILQEIRTELGFGVTPMDEGELNRRTIKQRLDQIEANLNNCIQEFKNQYNEAINPSRSECVKIVANNSENRIDVDAATLSHQISQSDDGIELLGGKSMATFLAKEQTDIIAQMTETYRQLSLDRIQVDDVVTKAQELLDSGSSDIQNLASRSNPYQMFTDTYIPFVVKDSPNIIFGHVGKALTDLNNSLSGKGFPFEVSASSVDHLLFFYQEEAGFALDDLRASHTTLADKFLQSPGEYGHSTHQNADFYNLELYDKIQKLQDWCRALGRIVPEICQHINKDAFFGVFYQTKNGYIYEYNVDGLSERLGLHNNPDEIKRLSQKQNETEYNKFISSVRSRFMQLNREHVTQLINSLLREIEDNQEHTSISQFFRQFLDDVYSEDASIDNTDSDPVSGSTFFQTPPQTHQQTPIPQPDNTSATPNQDVVNENVPNPTADPYNEVASEESEIDAGFFNQGDTEHNVETVISPEDTSSQDSEADANDDIHVKTKVEPDTQPSPTEEAAGEDSPSQQQTQPETGEQEKQKQTSTGFSVKNPNVKQTLQRKGTRKKE